MSIISATGTGPRRSEGPAASNPAAEAPTPDPLDLAGTFSRRDRRRDAGPLRDINPPRDEGP